MDAETVILGLIGLLQVVFLLLVNRIFSHIDNLFKIVAKQKEDIRKETTELLDKHYVTNGELNTLEQSLLGEVKLINQTLKEFTDKLSIILRREVPK